MKTIYRISDGREFEKKGEALVAETQVILDGDQLTLGAIYEALGPPPDEYRVPAYDKMMAEEDEECDCEEPDCGLCHPENGTEDQQQFMKLTRQALDRIKNPDEVIAGWEKEQERQLKYVARRSKKGSRY